MVYKVIITKTVYVDVDSPDEIEDAVFRSSNTFNEEEQITEILPGGHTDDEWEKAVENIKTLRNMAQSIPMGFFYVAECNRMLREYENGDRSEELFEEMRDAH